MNNIFKSTVFVGLALMTASCAKHDLIGDRHDIGERVPTTYWEVGSTVCKAGQEFTFKGKYYTQDGHVPDHSEVWYEVDRAETAAATVKLAGSLSYTQTVNDTRVMRANQSIIAFPHAMASEERGEFIINAAVPTSSTLSPVDWVNASQWDQEKFNSYYPEGFAEEFCEKVIDYLTKDSTYYSSLRAVYLNYNFSNELVAEINGKYGTDLPTDINMEDATTDKSDRWFATTEASEAAIVGYYYTTIDEAGNTIIHEVAKDYVDDSVNLWPVYKSAPWVFCRYSDDTGSILTTVRAAYMPAFKELLTVISFPEWIYDSVNKCYAVSFSRSYSLQSQFRVYDTEGHEGIASDTRTISIN